MAPSGHRRNLHPNLHPCRTGDSSSPTNKIGRTKHCSVRYNLHILCRRAGTSYGTSTRMRLHRTAVITTQRGRFNENRNTFDWLNEIATPLVLGIIKTSGIIAII